MEFGQKIKISTKPWAEAKKLGCLWSHGLRPKNEDGHEAMDCNQKMKISVESWAMAKK